MPRDKDFKRLIRARMEKTGEAYTTARARLIEKQFRTPADPAPGEMPAAQPRSSDLATFAGMADDVVAAKTGRTWAEWVRSLDGHDAHRLPHREIAALVHGTYGVDGWWSQTVTVGFERIRGLREKGQRRDGKFEAGRSRTFGVPVDALFRAWADDASRNAWLTGADPTVRTAMPPRSLRLAWPDGSTVALWFTEKGEKKSVVSVQHMKLPDREAADAAKVYWAGQLDALLGYLTRKS